MPFHEVDVYVGRRVRQRRMLLGMSQTSLGRAVGLTFQQVQKYERGFNRMSASKLFEFAEVLDVSVSYFFAEMPTNASKRDPKLGRVRKGIGEGNARFGQSDHLTTRETLELVRAYYKIRTKVVRNGIAKMIKTLAMADTAPERKGGASVGIPR